MIWEFERSKVLQDAGLLDTEPENSFDDIAKIASYVCNMPIALVSLIDNDRQFFKSSIGLNVRQTPIEESFCKIAAKTPDKLFAVEDARTDSRFKNNKLVNEYPKVVSYYGAPLKSKEGVAYGTLCVIDQKINVLTDEQKSILEKLSRQVEYLIELRIGTKKLHEYHAKLEKHSKDMEDFANMAAHDLKAPVRAIHSFVTLLDKKYENTWDIKDKKYIDFVHQSTKKMNSLIHDLLEFSKSTNSAAHFEDFDLNTLVAEHFEQLSSTSNRPKPILSCDVLPVIRSSKIAFSVLFSNLIENALKYQLPDAIAKIEIRYTDTQANRIFTITDNGIGIDAAYFDEIFKPFKRLHTSAEYAGNGLGLAACKKIIEHLNGEICISASSENGTTFTLTIPKNSSLN